MTVRRFYANAAPQQTLTGPITNSGTSLTVSGSFAGWPSSYPFFGCLEYGTASMELVSVTNIVGTTATIVRGQDGTSAISHLGGATFDQVAVRQDFDEASAHTSSNSGVHGATTNVVGIGDTQTLTNKTLTSPIISNPSITGTATAATVTASGLVTANAGLTVVGGETVDSVTASKFIKFPSYTTQAAATAAIGSPVDGQQVYLSAPTGTGNPGVYTYYSGGWNSPTESTLWQAYTPTWGSSGTQPTLGNGTLFGRYVQTGPKTITFRVFLKIGSTTSGGTGVYTFLLPTQAATDQSQFVDYRIATTAGSVNFLGFGYIAASSTTAQHYANFTAGSSQITQVQGGTPSLNTNSEISMWGTYETA